MPYGAAPFLLTCVALEPVMSNEKLPSLTATGEIRGFFEVFLPGLFLLLHVLLLVYCAAPTGPAGAFVSQFSRSDFAIISAIGLPLGYVLGLAMRLGRTSYADKVSGWMVLILPSGRRLYASADKWWANSSIKKQIARDDPTKPTHREGLPYPSFMMARVSKSLPPKARSFYELVWLEQPSTPDEQRYARINLFRFNFFKELVASVDSQAASDMFAAEMMVRHAAHMCYALFFAGLLLCISSVLPGAGVMGLRLTLLLLACGEWFVLIVGLLPNLRFLRVSEAELAFTCCFRNRDTLERLIKNGN